MMGDIKSSTTVCSEREEESVQPFSELGPEFNLNSPPTNWLRGAGIAKQPWVPSSAREKSALSSLTSANCYMNSVGKVDVISSCKNVKEILKLPYDGNASMSMVVHRVGRTLLVDSLDVYKQVLKVQEDDWRWIKDFIVENLVESRENHRAPVAAQRKEIEEQLMLSKFLYHSIENKPERALVPRAKMYIQPTNPCITDPLEDENELIEVEGKHERDVLWTFEDITMLVGTDIPIFGSGKHPVVSLKLRDMRKPINVLTGLDYWLDQLMANVPECAMCYHLNGIVQKYEIIPTEDLPKIAGSQFSPELVKDVAQNILSFLKSNATKEGHTYWLFKDENDEVVKLYDLSSLCKGYLDEDVCDINPFTLPVAILMYRVAKNLLHNTKQPRRAANTVFRLLNNCLSLLSRDKYPQVVGSIHYLLANVYLTYGTCGTTTNSGTNATPEPKGSPKKCKKGKGESGAQTQKEESPFPDPPEYDCDDEWALDGHYMDSASNETSSCVAVNILKRPGGTYEHVETGSQTSKANTKKPLPNSSNLDDCCKQALENIYEGLDCADVLLKQGNSKENGNSAKDGDTESDVDPNKAIPLQYEPIKKNEGVLPLTVRYPLRESWQTELVCLLLNRAAVAYSCLADLALTLSHFGRTLTHAKFAIICLEAVLKMSHVPETSKACLRRCKDAARLLMPVLLSHCGHAYFSLYQTDPSQLARHEAELERGAHFRDMKICEKANKVVIGQNKEDLSWVTCGIPDALDGPFKLLELADRCLTITIDKMNNNANTSTKGKGQQKWIGAGDLENAMPKVETHDVIRMLGNVKNEIGKFYTNLLTERVTTGEPSQWEGTVKFPDNSSKIEYLSSMAARAFKEGVANFALVNDNSNQALLQSNLGRLYRLLGHKIAEEGEHFSKDERKYFFEAIECYQSAVLCLERMPGSNVWEAIAHELASTYHSMATHMQNRPPIATHTQQQIVLDIVDFMKRALNLYEKIIDDKKIDPKVQQALSEKIFEVHYQLAGLHFKLMMDKNDTSNRKWKQLRNTTEEHYNQACNIYNSMIMPTLAKSHTKVDMRSIRKSLMFLRMQLEKVAFVEYIIEMTHSAVAKSKLILQALIILVNECSSDLGYLAECFESKGENVFKELMSSDQPEKESESENEETLNDANVSKGTQRNDKEIDAGLGGELRLLGKTFLDRCQILTKAQLQIAITNCKGKSKGSLEMNDCDVWKTVFKNCLVCVPEKVTDYPTILNEIIHKIEPVFNK